MTPLKTRNIQEIDSNLGKSKTQKRDKRDYPAMGRTFQVPLQPPLSTGVK